VDSKVQRINSLIEGIAGGNKNALDALFFEFGGLLLAMAKKYVVDKSKAEDILSEVLLRLVKSAKGFKKEFNGLNWLFKSIKNEALNQNKKDRLRQTDNIDKHYNLKDVIDFTQRYADSIAINDALKKLSDLENKALYLKFWHGLTVREIASELKMAKSSCHDLIARALKKLGSFLEDKW